MKNLPLPLSVIIVTKDVNVEDNSFFEQTLLSVKDFEDVWIVNSGEDVELQKLAHKHNAHFMLYAWDGHYPKKRQYCLENISTKYNWILFLDADELMTSELIQEISLVFQKDDIDQYGGFFIKGQYIWRTQLLKYGLKNNKLCLLHKERVSFPIIDDLPCESMGEIEGHYQPILKDPHYKIGQLQKNIIHNAFLDMKGWKIRHKKYAIWEAYMLLNKTYPKEASYLRGLLKYSFQHIPFRPISAFFHSYILKRGFLDGHAGLLFAKTRYQYYKMVNDSLKE